MKTLTPILACLATSGALSTLHAAVILQYDSATASANALSIVGTTDTALVSAAAATSTLGANSAFASRNTQTQVQGAGDQGDLQFRFGVTNANGGGTVIGNDFDAALAGGSFIEFSFTAAANITLDNLDFDLFVNSQNGSNYAARDAALFVDVAGAGFNQFGSSDTSATGNGGQGTITFSDSVDALTGDVITYRIAFTDRTNGSTNNQSATRVGNVQISGFATVPEPSSTALLGLGGLALVMRRRKA